MLLVQWFDLSLFSFCLVFFSHFIIPFFLLVSFLSSSPMGDKSSTGHTENNFSQSFEMASSQDMDLDVSSSKRGRHASGSSTDSDSTLKGAKVAKTVDECMVLISSSAVNLSKENPVKIKQWLENLVGNCQIRVAPKGGL